MNHKAVIISALLLPALLAGGCAARGAAEDQRDEDRALMEAYEKFNAAAPQMEADVREFVAAQKGVASAGRVKLTVTSALILGAMKEGVKADKKILEDIRRFVLEKYNGIGIILPPERVQITLR